MAGFAGAGMLAMLAGVASASPASAAYGDSAGNNLSVGVRVVVTGGGGDPVPAGGGSFTVHVPAKCAWVPMTRTDFDSGDAAAFQEAATEFVGSLNGSSINIADYYSMPSPEAMQAAVDAEAAGTDGTWYQLQSQDGVNCADEGFTNSRGGGPMAGGAVPVAFAFFANAVGTPPPMVEIPDVVTEVWELASQQLENPVMDRNPKMAGAGGATLVNLPSWFWVTNPAAAFAGDGEIRLEVTVPGTPAQAVLTADTDGLTVASPAGATNCTVEQALNSYSRGEDDAAACTIPFERANPAGWSVSNTIQWNGTWTGQDSDGPDAGTLDPVTLQTDYLVPVREAQSVVTGTH